MIATKQVREQSKDSRAEDIELTLFAVDAALDLYRSRAATATRHSRDLLPRALAAFPRAPERRKPTTPAETKGSAKTHPKADSKFKPQADAKPEAFAETSAKPPATPTDAPAAQTAARPWRTDSNGRQLGSGAVLSMRAARASFWGHGRSIAGDVRPPDVRVRWS